MRLNINADAVVVLSNKLEKMRKTSLPAAIKTALNSAAFDVKKNTMPKTAEREFIQRSANFFKANSKVEMASGSDIRMMKATVGFVGKSGNKSDQAVDDLEAQEYGGTIKSRSFIPMDTARGGSHSEKVKPSNRIGSIKNVINSNTVSGKTPQQQFRHAAAKAGKGGYVIGNNSKKTLYKVVDISPGKIKLKPLFSFSKGRSVKVRPTGFMRDASLQSGSRIDQYFIDAATKQIEKL